MKTYSLWGTIVFLCLTITMGVTHAIAQATTATISGIALDQSGASIGGATVKVRNTTTNIEHAAQTADDGRYSFPVLPIGTYEVTFELVGFKKVVYERVELTPGQPPVVNTVLTVTTTAETVTVTGGAPLINTTNAEGSTSFDGPRMSNLPSLGMSGLGGGLRDGWSFGLSTPGVSQINQGNLGGPTGTKYSVNGKGLRSNSFTVDGQDVTDPTSAGRQMSWNNPDAMQDFRIITSQFAAEHGRTSGSIVSLATRSGTNLLHGNLSWFHNSNEFNSRSNVDKAGGLTKAPLHIENQFGGTLGGPVVRDKMFFFGSLQRWTDRNLFSGTTLKLVPTEGGRAVLQTNGGSRVTTKALLENLPAAQGSQTGVVRYCFNAAPWTGSVAPPALTQVNPGQFVCGPAAAPVVGWSVLTVPVGSFGNSNLIRYNDWQGLSRVDYHINSSQSLSGRYMFNDDLQTGIGQATPPGVANTAPSRSQAATVSLVSNLSPAFVNELRVSWSRYAFETGPQMQSALSIPSIEIPDLGLTGTLSVAPRTALGYPANLPEGRRNNIYQLANNMTWTHGGHTTKWGADIRKQDMASVSTSNVRGQLRYSSLTNFVADFADTTAAIARPLPGGEPVMHFRWTDWFFFAQDDWKVTPHFTLNLGLRYELPGNAIESLYPVNDRIVAANGNNPLFRMNSRPPRDKNNFMPRFGFNWDLGGKGVGFLDNVVVRGGYARTNDYAFLIMAVQASGGFPFQALFNIRGTPGTFANLSAATNQTLTLPAAAMLSQTLFSDDFHTPYSDQYSLEVQRALGVNNVFRIGYVGTKGTGLFQNQEGNPTTRCGSATCPRVDPTRGVMRVRTNTGSSIYHSMQVSLDHRFSKGFSGGMHYTWSAFIDNGSEIVNPSTSEIATPQDPFNRNAGERARSTYDRPHRLTGNLVYELPFMTDQRGTLGRIIGGWQVGTLSTFQSGSPFTVLNGSDPGGVLAASLVGVAIRPNFAPGVKIEELRRMPVTEIRRRVMEAGDPSIFFLATGKGGPTVSAPTGNVPRNFLRSDGIVSIDFNVVKNFTIGEGRTLQLRADMFNLPNTRNFGIPQANANLPASSFLDEGAVDAGNRRIFLALRYKF